MENKLLPVKGMHCASCASVITRKLEKLEGVETCAVNYATEKAQISFDPKKITISDMNNQIEKLGYTLTDATKPMDHSLHQNHDMMTPLSSDASIKEYKLKELAKLKTHVQIVLPMVMVSIFVMVWEIGAETFGLWQKMPETLMEFSIISCLFLRHTLSL